MSEWISVEDRKPSLDSTVLGYCPIYGRAIRWYGRIMDTNHGQWDDVVDGDMGGLPPTHWTPLLEPPESGERYE